MATRANAPKERAAVPNSPYPPAPPVVTVVTVTRPLNLRGVR